jgi:hypothetical protein
MDTLHRDYPPGETSTFGDMRNKVNRFSDKLKWFVKNQARTSFTTFPCTSVSRKRRPWNLNVNCS